jgi:hypothetical protein
MASKRQSLSRRTLLRGMLAGSAVLVGLPILDIFLNDNGTAFANGGALPKRFGVFYWGNGNLPERWLPSGTGAAWELSETLAPLAPVKDAVTVVSGMKIYTGGQVPHFSGAAGMLSGAPLPTGKTDTFSEPSIDQVIAKVIGQETRFPSLEVAVQPGAPGLSYHGIYNMNPPETSPWKFFDRIFGEGFIAPGTVVEPDPRLGLRRSVLDAIGEDAKRLQKKLGAADKQRLDQHLSGIEKLESQLLKLEQSPPALTACSVPAAPQAEYPNIDGRPQMSAISRAMADVLVMALACDQTRVFSDWFSMPISNVLFKGATSGHHQLTHDEPGDQPQVAAILLQVMEELTYLISALRAVPEGDGTLLDHCAILATSDCSYGRAHSVEEYPILIAGSCSGALKQGIHYRSVSNENASKVLFTLCRAMGLNMDTFGKGPGEVNTSLAGIEA